MSGTAPPGTISLLGNKDLDLSFGWTELFVKTRIHMARNLEKRLARVEQKLADMEMESALASCICKMATIVWTDEEEEAERNRKCPAHENRQHHFIRLRSIGANGQEVSREEAVRRRPEVGKPCNLRDLVK